MNDIMRIVQALENSNILLKGVSKTIKNKSKFLGKHVSRKRNCKSWFWE